MSSVARGARAASWVADAAGVRPARAMAVTRTKPRVSVMNLTMMRCVLPAVRS